MIRTLDEDGTLHFNHLKKIAESGIKYLHAVNTPNEPTSAMLVGTVAHVLLLGKRHKAKEVIKYDGRRAGKDWDAFAVKHADKEIVSASEWAKAEQIAEAVRRFPIARGRLSGARTEVPFMWEENGIPCSTDGVDIIPLENDLGDLKTTPTTNPEKFKAHAFKMHYAHQLVWYARGARANGHTVRDLFVLGVETKAPFEVVELRLAPSLIEIAERELALWLEKLRGYMLSIPEPTSIYDWPGYAQAAVEWEPPAWMSDEDEEDFDDEEAA